eukprot:4820698-Prymnesium_polylepis.1
MYARVWSHGHTRTCSPAFTETSLQLIYEWAGLTRGAEAVKDTLSSLDSEPEAQEGPTPRPRCSQSEEDREASLVASCEARDWDCARLRHALEPLAPLLQLVSCGTLATNQEGE